MPFAWVYIITNRNNTVLYTGVTTNLPNRLKQHKTKKYKNSFSGRYNVYKLIYYECFDSIIKAIAREKFIKGKSRRWKNELIKKVNPLWDELTVGG